LAVGRRAWKQVLDLVEWEAAIFQLGWAAFGDTVQRCADVAQRGKALIIPPDVRELSAPRGNLVVSQLLALPAASPRRQDHYLPVTHGLWISQSEDSGVLKLPSKSLAAVPDVHRRDHKGQNAARFQPAVRVRKEHPLCAFASSFSDGPVVGRI
jgi:hypothetical protein